MEIKIRKLKITHFKGIKDLEVGFGDVTTISGDNATGKTSVMDAFLWALFGKDSSDRKEFEIKPISSNGSPKDVEVEADLVIDGKTHTLKRVYREKWVKKRGSVEVEFAGHETTFFWNEVPVTMKEYQDKIALICPEDAFKMLTNPMMFPSLKWQTQREVLFQIAGEVSDNEVAKGNPELEKVLKELEGKTLVEYKKQIANQKRRIKDELEPIPSRIDEVQRGIPAEEDWKGIENDIKLTEKQLKSIEDQITDQSKAYEKAYAERTKLQDELYQNKHKLREIIEKHKEEALSGVRKAEAANREAEDRIRELSVKNNRLASHLEGLHNEANQNENKREELRLKWHTVNKKVFTPESDTCPTCGQHIDVDIEGLMEKFNQQKAQEIADITAKGKALKERYDHLVTDIKTMEAEEGENLNVITGLKNRITPVTTPEVNEDDIPGVSAVKNIIGQLEARYNTPIEAPDVEGLKKDKAILMVKIEDGKRLLSFRDQITKGKSRIRELEQQQQKLAQELSDMEGVEYAIFLFEKAKVDAIEKKVNSMFNITKFKLFETQINGGEVPVCVATHNNVPYPDLNSAAKINVGIDIMNVLSEYHDTYAPLWIDNREGCNNIIETKSQVINLVVNKEPKLVIETV